MRRFEKQRLYSVEIGHDPEKNHRYHINKVFYDEPLSKVRNVSSDAWNSLSFLSIENKTPSQKIPHLLRSFSNYTNIIK